MAVIIQHPLIQHKLSLLRNRKTGTKEFRETLQEISGLMAYEITRDLPVSKVHIETPLQPCVAGQLSRDVVLVPVLRAGLGMVEGISSLIPTAKVGHMGLYRDHETLEPMKYYAKFPENLGDSEVLLLDPMLATGGSASAAIFQLKSEGATHIKLICIVGAPEGVRRIEQDHPEVTIYLAALDDGLNESGYIVPGLGDAGDRLFGTR